MIGGRAARPQSEEELPLISVVVPVQSAEILVEETLTSLSRATHQQLEVILVVEGPSGRGAEVAAAFGRRDPRFSVVMSPATGPGGRWNAGVARARGEFVAFVEAGDVIPAYAFAAMIATAEHTGSDIIAGGVRILEDGRLTGSKTLGATYADTSLRTTLRDFPLLMRDLGVQNKIYRRVLWQDGRMEFPDDLGAAGETVFALRAAAAARSIDVIRTPVYYQARRAQPRGGAQSASAALIDRIAAFGRVTSDLAEQSDDALANAWHDGALRYHMRAVIDGLNALPATDQPPVITAAKTYLAGVPTRVIDKLPSRLRGEIKELVAGRVPVRRSQPKSTKGLDPKALKRRAKTLGKKLAHTAELITHVHDLAWHGDHVVVRGELAMYGRTTAALPRLGARAIWLRETSGSRRSAVRLRPTTLTRRHHGTARTGFEITIEPAALKLPDQDAWRAGNWVLSLNIAAGRHVFRSVLAPNPTDGPAPTLESRRLDADTWFSARVSAGQLEFNVVKQNAAAAETALIGSILHVSADIDEAATDVTAELGRVDGVPEYRTTARISTDGTGTRVRAEIDLDKVTVAIGPTEIAPIGHMPDRWYVWFSVAGQMQPIRIDRDNRAMYSNGSFVASVHPEERGRLAIAARLAIPTATQMEWHTDGTLIISGVGPAADGDEIVLRFAAQREERAWRITPTAGGWTTRITPTQADSAAGWLPLRKGTWRILVRMRRDGETYVTDLPVDADAFDAARGLMPNGERTFWLNRAGIDTASLTSAGQYRTDDTHRAATTYYRDAWYPRQRRAERLRDAVFYSSFVGRQYSDSPRAVHEELVRRGVPVEHLWHTNDGQIALPPNTTSVTSGSRAFYDALATSKYLVVNSHLPHWFRRREGQIVVQTWHGTPLKKIAFDMPAVNLADKTYLDKITAEVPQWSYLISPNSFSTPHLERAFRYGGEMLEIGYPRNDVLATENQAKQQQLRQMLAERLGIPAGKKIILYAPTWRDDQFYATGRYKLEFQLDTRAAARALGHEYVLLVRRHPNIVDNVPGTGDGFVFDVSTYPDMADLLAATDVLITDYSSVMFDFAVTGRPMIFFTYDLEYYRDSLRGFYFDFEPAAPGPLVATSDELIATLRDIDSVHTGYQARYQAFREQFCDFDDGKATARLIDRVFAQVAATARK